MTASRPALEVGNDGTDVLLPMITECITAEGELLCFLLFAVHGAEERAAFGSEHGLGVLGVAELAASVRVAASFKHGA